MFFFFGNCAKKVDSVLSRGYLNLGTFSNIDCANVECNGKVLRLVSLRSFLGIVGVPINSKRGVNGLMDLLENRNTKTTVSESIAGMIRNGYSLDDGTDELYLDSRILTKFCRFILNLRAIHKIEGVYLGYARKCEQFMMGLADTGLTALIDEATGYKKRQRDEYRQLFLQFIQDEHTTWLKEFQDSFFDGIYKIYNLQKMSKNRHPGFFGAFIAKYVYYPLANSHGAILENLREKNPVFNLKGRRYKHHQFLTAKVGKVALRDHLSKMEVLFALSKDKGAFKRIFKKVFPQPYDQLELDFGDDV